MQGRRNKCDEGVTSSTTLNLFLRRGGPSATSSTWLCQLCTSPASCQGDPMIWIFVELSGTVESLITILEGEFSFLTFSPIEQISIKLTLPHEIRFVGLTPRQAALVRTRSKCPPNGPPEVARVGSARRPSRGVGVLRTFPARRR